MILGLVQEALDGGARLSRACETIGVDARTVQRWKRQGIGEDRRAGPKKAPGNKLSQSERRRILELANSPEHRDLSPKQIVPRLADQGKYVASESTFYRVLRQEKQQHHRAASAAPDKRHRPRSHTATGPNQVWSWDITYLKSPVRGVFFYLYLVTDVWSRKITGWAVHLCESSTHASELLRATCQREGINKDGLVVHSDNGSPMKGATLLATLQSLGIVASFSRPRVSDDNPFSEALFRTLKYRPEYPVDPFASLEAARAWLAWFVHWYNTEHLHSGIRFVTPEQRHRGEQLDILAKRQAVYLEARRRHPERWSRNMRDWSPINEVQLNPEPHPADTEAA